MNQHTLLIDFDSTFIRKEALDELAEISLIGRSDKAEVLETIKSITHAGMNGEISFEESLKTRLAALDLHRVYVDQTSQYLSLRHNISPSFLQYQDEIAKNADNIFIISGGFREIILPVAEQFSIDPTHVFANSFRFDQSGRFLGIDWGNPLSQDGGKVKVARGLRDEGKFTSPVIAIGDGNSDRQLKTAGVADVFIAFTETIARPNIIADADGVTNTFSDIADYLGWPRPATLEGHIPPIELQRGNMPIRSRR